VRLGPTHLHTPSHNLFFAPAGLVMGIALLLTSFLSVGAIIQRNHVTMGLVVLNWVLIADAVIVLIHRFLCLVLHSSRT
jgi:hypothetical protein